jgi:hypothetical protein
MTLRVLTCLLLPLAAAIAAGQPPGRADLEARLGGLDGAKPPAAAARASVHQATLALGAPSSADAGWWFAELRRRAASATHPEMRAFLESQLLLDPSVRTASPQDPAPVAPAPYAFSPQHGHLARLVDSQRSLEMGERPALRPAELAAAALSKDDPELADRSLVLLRRMEPATAAPLLWQRLGAAKARSAALRWEEELQRVPLADLARGFPSKPGPEWSKPARAAWLRIVAIRPALRADKESVLALLKGPADELTEAAWDAVPNVLGASDRARVEAAAQGLSERLQPRAKEALERLR